MECKHTACRPSALIPDEIRGRREFLQMELRKYQGKAFHCKSIGVNVIVTEKSIKEVSYNAASSRKSAELALYLPFVIRNAEIVSLHLPTESRKQIRDFHFGSNAPLTRWAQPRL